MRCKVIINETPPEEELIEIEGQPPIRGGYAGVDLGFLWFKPSISTFYKVTSLDPLTWEEVDFKSGNFGDINFTGTISADGTAGITGQKTIGGYRITFKKGLLTGFEQV